MGLSHVANRDAGAGRAGVRARAGLGVNGEPGGGACALVFEKRLPTAPGSYVFLASGLLRRQDDVAFQVFGQLLLGILRVILLDDRAERVLHLGRQELRDAPREA